MRTSSALRPFSRHSRLLLVLATATVLAACSRPSPPEEPVRSVKLMTVGVGALQSSLEYSGEVRARVESRLGFRVAGKIVQRQAELGQRVKAGQVLAQLDPKDYQLAAEAARAQLNAQQLRLKFTQVLAPDSGVISARTATVGAVVGSGTELFRMVRKGRLEWRAEVTQAELARIRTGAKVQVTAASGAAVEGTVRMVAQTRNALVYVDLPAHADIRAGMFARGDFALGEGQALTVPQEAVVVRDGFFYVFVVDGQQRVQQRKVQPGRRVADRVEITAGLDAGATVAVRGAGFLNEGDLVRVANDTADSKPKQAPAPAPQAPAASK